MIENVYNLAQKYGDGDTKTYNFYTKAKYNLEFDDLIIRLNDGGGEMGGGEVKVFCKNKLVLHADRYANEKNLIPKVKGWGVLAYHAGEWEEEIEKIPKKIKNLSIDKNPKIVDSEVSEEMIDQLKIR